MPQSSGRKKPGSRRAPARSRKSKRARQSRWRSGLRLAWELLPLFLLLFVALAAFVLDPEALVRLAWACVSGTFGTGVQVTGSVVIVAGAAAIAWAFWPEPFPAKRRPARAGSGPRRRTRPATSRARPAPAESGPDNSAPVLPEAAAPDPASATGGADENQPAEVIAPAQRRKPRRRPPNPGQREQDGSVAANAAAE